MTTDGTVPALGPQGQRREIRVTDMTIDTTLLAVREMNVPARRTTIASVVLDDAGARQLAGLLAPSDGEPTYTRAQLLAGLVTKQQIAEQVQVDLANVSNWAARYEDWPRPFLPVRGFGRHDGGNGTLYWWPEVAEFLNRHGLPRERPTRGEESRS